MTLKAHLGDWLVNEEANLLSKEDSNVRLEKRVMAVLVELAKADGAVVSKEALIEAVWNGAIISDHSVANAVSDLRRALGDDRRNPKYIETVPKRGYRLLITPKTPDDHPPGEAPDPTPVGLSPSTSPSPLWRPAAIALLMVLLVVGGLLWRNSATAPPRLFLADIENVTGDEIHNIAAATAAEMLTSVLAGSEYRLVRWRDVSVTPEDTNKKDRVLYGRMILDGAAPLLSMQLVDGADQSVIWAASYPIGGARLASTAQSIVADLGDPLALERNTPALFASIEPEIFEQYWRARYLWSLREHGAIRNALDILNGITDRAPDFAPAHAAIADIYAHKTAEELGLDRADTFARAEVHLNKAFEINPSLGDAFVSKAYLSFFRDNDPDAAFDEIDRAIALSPENAVAWQTKAMIASAADRTGQSLEAVARARALDPLSPSLLWDEVWFLYLAGNYEEALDAAARARRVSAPVIIYEAFIYLALNDEENAFRLWLARAELRGLDIEKRRAIEAIAEQNGARAGLTALADSGYSEFPAARAALLSALGREDEAVRALLVYQEREKSWWLNWFDVMPVFAVIRDDPRLQVYSRNVGAAAG